MKPTKDTTPAAERRKSERRDTPERREDVVRAATGDRRVVETRGVATAMVDALSDILAWERASERSMKVAMKAPAIEGEEQPQGRLPN